MNKSWIKKIVEMEMYWVEYHIIIIITQYFDISIVFVIPEKAYERRRWKECEMTDQWCCGVECQQTAAHYRHANWGFKCWVVSLQTCEENPEKQQPPLCDTHSIAPSLFAQKLLSSPHRWFVCCHRWTKLKLCFIRSHHICCLGIKTERLNAFVNLQLKLITSGQ